VVKVIPVLLWVSDPPCCGYLTSNQKVLIYTRHIKSKAQTLFFYPEKKITDKIIGQNFCRSQNFILTPAIIAGRALKK